MDNAEIAAQLDAFAALLELNGASYYTARAYRRAAELIRDTRAPVAELVEQGRARELRGIGPGIETRLLELVETGELEELRELQETLMPELVGLGQLLGVGPKRMRELAQALDVRTTDESVRVLLDPTGPGSAHIQELLAGSQRMEPAAIRAALDRAHDELGLAVCVDHVLMPAMRQIGAWWETGRCDVAQEHLTTEVARGWLARTIALAPAPSHDRPVLLACGPRDLHTLGLEALAGLLAYRGRGCRVLGARTPERTLVTAAIATDAAAVVVVSHLATQRRPAVEALRAVAANRAPVFYAGNAFLFPGARSNVPGTYLGDSLATAADVITAALTDVTTVR